MYKTFMTCYAKNKEICISMNDKRACLLKMLTGVTSEGPVTEGPLAADRRRMNHLFIQMY